jgi:hypothetical protein
VGYYTHYILFSLKKITQKPLRFSLPGDCPNGGERENNGLNYLKGFGYIMAHHHRT